MSVLFVHICEVFLKLMKVMKWRPPGRRKRGRPKLTWAEGIRGLMGEKGLMEEDWNDRNSWRKKII
jgi:hypothetical protein